MTLFEHLSELKTDYYLARKGVVGLIPLPPLEQFAVAISPEREPALLTELDVSCSRAVQTAAARGAGVDFTRELDLTSERRRKLRHSLEEKLMINPIWMCYF